MFKKFFGIKGSKMEKKDIATTMNELDALTASLLEKNAKTIEALNK